MREIDGHKRTIKLIKAKHDSVAGEIELERQDIERGYVWEHPPEPQQELPLENEAPTMPPPEPLRTGQPGVYEKWEAMYPPSKDWQDLIGYLKAVLTEAQCARFLTEDEEPIVGWRPDSGVFNAVDNWARIECAKADSEAKAKVGAPVVGGLTIPARVEMPELLADIVLDKPKPKRGKRGASVSPNSAEGGSGLSNTSG